MAEKEGDLIFPMRLEVDPSKFKSGWDKIEPELQKIIDAKPLKVKLDINDVATNKIKAAVHKQAKETEEVVENSIKAIQREMKAMTGASENLDIFGDTKAIDALIQKSRDLKNTINEVKTAALPLKDILSIGGKTPTGLDLKRQKDELQRFISLEKEGSKDAIVANEKLIQVKERLRNMYGKQESALKATDEEKKVNETIAAYKRLSSELDKINARIRIRESIKSGSIIAPSSVSVSSMGTKTEAEMYNGIAQAMDRYKTSLSAVNQEKLKATPGEASKSEIALGNQNLYIQTKIEEAAKRASAEQSKLWGRYGQALKGPENTIYQIEKKLEKIASIRTDLKMNPAQIKEADSAVSALKQKLDGLKNPLSATGQLANLNKQWAALSAQERKSAAGKDIIEKYRQIDKAAGGASGTLRNAALKTNQFSTALNKNAQELKSQRGLMNGMPQMMNSYISILGAYRLGKNIVDTTAEFEMQRVALAAIIQNKTKADELFAKSVEMGIESPFLIKDIITYTKQLAAYRIETDKLFDTTKRLADVSAGLGVGMDRLILAYGQVKAASVLRGQELRQFTEAGIPLVELLADKFTILNGKATTTADVFDLIRARGVSFEMVKEIFDDMTNSGGMFYNMQAIQAQTLKGSMSNLRDAMDRTFMQMGEGAKGPIKDMIDGLRYLMENWREVSNVLGGIVGVMAVAKLATIAYSRAVGQETASIIANTMAEKRSSAIRLMRLSATRDLTGAETLELATMSKLTLADYRTMAAKGALSKEMLLQLVATKRMTISNAEAIGSIIGVTSAEIAQAASKKKLIVYTKLFTAALRVQLVALRTTMAAMLSNPLTWIAVAAAGLIKLVSGIVKYNKEYTEMAANMRKESTALSGSMADSYKGMAASIKKAFGKGASEQAMMSTRKSMQDILEKNELIKDLLADRLSKLLTEKERLEEVRDMWNEVYGAAKNDPGYMASAQKGTGGFLNDDVVENAEKVADKLNEIDSYLAKTGAKGYNVTGVRDEFNNLREQFEQGAMSISQFDSALLSMMIHNKGSLDGTVFQKLNGKVKGAQDALRGFEVDMTSMAKSTIAQIGAINGKMPVFGVDKFGLSDKSLGVLQSKLATQTNFWLQALGDIDAGAKRLLTTQMKLQSKFPFTKVADVENPYAKSYNDFLEKRGLSKVSPMDLKDMEKSDATQLEAVSNALKTAEEELKRYNAQVDAGNNLNKEKISDSKEEVRQLKIAWAFLGGTEKEAAKKTDPRIATINEQVRATKEAYKEYAELTKWMSAEEAKKKTTDMYGGVDTSMFGLVFSDADLERVLREASVKMGDISKKDAQKIAMDASGVGFDVFKKAIKDKLDKLSRDIQQTQEANDFFESMLGLTGSEDAARRMTESLGLAVGDMRATLRQAFGDVMKTGGYTDDIDFKNIGGMQKMVNAIGPEEIRKAAQERLDAIIDYEKKEAKAVYDGLGEFMTAEQKKVIIIAETARKIKAIEAGPGDAVTKKANIDARIAKRDADLTAVDYEELKKLPSYVKAFEDLDRVGDKTLTLLRADLVALAKSTKDATALKTLMDQVQKIDELLEGRHPFASMVDGLNDYRHAVDLAAVALEFFGENSEEYAAAQDMIRASIDKTKKSIQRLKSDFDEASGAITSVIDLSKTLTGTLGLSFSDETNEYIDAFTGGIEIASSALSAMTAVTIALDAALAPLLIAAAAIGLMFVGITAATNAMNADTERDIKNNAKAIDALADSITKLNDALSDSVGSKYVKNVQAQIAANKEIIRLQREQIENNKDLSDTKASGWWLLGGAAAYGIAWVAAKKKTDEAKKSIKESEKEVAEREKEIAELERALMQQTTGYSTVADAASAFADAWYQAYLSSENTFDLIGEKFKEMIDTMIVQSILAETVAAKLAPVFDAIKAAYDNDGIMTPEELAGIQNMTADITVGMDADLRNLVTGLRRSGVDVNPTRKSLSGISASVSAMSEDTANTLGGYLNAGLRQWVLQTEFQNRIATGVESMQKPLLDIYAMQGQSLAAISSIKTDTAIMVSKLTRIVDNQDATLNSGGQKAVNVRLIN